MKQAHIKPINCRIAPLKNKGLRKIGILTIFITIALNGYSQKPKKYTINREGIRTSKAFAKFNREVTKMDDKYLVKDFYLNGILQMEGSYKDKSLKQKTATFKRYYLKVANKGRY